MKYKLTDKYVTVEIQSPSSYWITVICFTYLALFAFLVKRILQKQGIDYDKNTSAGH